jgi:O-antigen/teichoic acid export membrane protein
MAMTEPSAGEKRGIYGHMVAGSLWALALRWGVRAIGLVNVLILARLLTPADFGIVAMATLLMAFVAGFTELGTDMLLIRMHEVTREDCDTAWTIGLLQGALVGSMLLVIAPFAVQYFSEPRLFPVVGVFALCAIAAATSNVGTVLIRRELDFAKDFRFSLYTKLATFFPTLALALWLRNYWALVMGHVVGTLVSVLISYRFHAYRPRFSLARVRQFLTFSVAIIGANVAKFLKAKVDVLVIGGSTSTALMGTYNVASELATMATREVVMPAWRGLFPSFATIRHDRERFLSAYGHLLSTIAILCLPLGLGLWVVAEDCVAVVLGSQWTAAVTPLKWLAICSTILAMMEVLSNNILFVSGHENRATLFMWAHLSVLVPAVAIAGKFGTVEAVAIAATLSAAVMLPISAIVLSRSIGFTLGMMWRALWRPLLAVGVMVAVLKLLPMPGEMIALVRLFSQVLLGATVYVTSLIGLWLLAGRPEGLEHVAWHTLHRVIAWRRP